MTKITGGPNWIAGLLAVRRLFYIFVYSSGLSRLFAWIYRHRVVVLCYHGVTPSMEAVGVDEWRLTVHADDFESHLRFIKRRYNPISVSDFIESRSGARTLPPRSVVITFDDGYRNFYTVAKPLLDKHDIPACVMVITDELNQDSADKQPRANNKWSPDDDTLYMTWEDLRACLKDKRIECGSHTCSHVRLTLLNAQEAEFELIRSRDLLLPLSDQKSISLAYPHGAFSDRLAEVAKQSGYGCAFTIVDGNVRNFSNSYHVSRVLVYGNTDLPMFASRLANIGFFSAGVRRHLRRLTIAVPALSRLRHRVDVNPVDRRRVGEA